MKRLLTLMTLLLVISSSFAQESFKDKYEQSFIHLSNENYKKALPILLEMEKMDTKNNNTLFSIGNCYMHTTYEKVKAIPYFEKILTNYKNMSVDYEVGNYKEKKAPVETFRLLGQAYHYNYQFEDAIERYNEYKDVLDPDNTAYLKLINRDIEITNNAMALKDKPVEMEIKGLENINTEFAEYRPKVTGDENIMYFTSRRKNSKFTKTDDEGKYYEDVYISRRKFGKWEEPVIMDAPINTQAHDACLYISPDGQYMLLFRASVATLTEGGIYETKLSGETWSEPSLLQADINSNYWETDVSVSADGRTIFFTSDRPGGTGGRDIWQMKKLPDGEWAKAQNMGALLNTEYDEEAPYLHPDGRTLYFSSKGHNAMGGYDVFRSEKQENGSWGTPVNIGYPINTTGDDVFYFPTNDGLRAYFSSYRRGGKGDQDIYILELPEFEEKTLAVYRGIAKYNDGEIIKDLIITIFDEESGEEIGVYRPNETTGRFLFILQPGQTYEVDYENNELATTDIIDVPEKGGVQDIVKIVVREGNTLRIETGKVNDADVITLVEVDDPTNLDITDISINGEKPTNGQIAILTDDQGDQDINIDLNNVSNTNNIDLQNNNTVDQFEITSNQDGEDQIDINNDPLGKELNDLYFEYDKVLLISKSEMDYSATLKWLQDNPTAKVKIEGHTDHNGSKEYNTWLSSARANKIRNRLNKDGIGWSRMKTYGYGESRPIAPNKNPDGTDNPEGRQLNRRVSFIVNSESLSHEFNSEEELLKLSFSKQTLSEDDILCTVQLGAFSQKMSNKKFTETPVEMSFYQGNDQLFRYFSGAFHSKSIALEHRQYMIDNGYEGAFIVYFRNGKRLTSEEIALLDFDSDFIKIQNEEAINQ